jgi:hypothetical protein
MAALPPGRAPQALSVSRRRERPDPPPRTGHHPTGLALAQNAQSGAVRATTSTIDNGAQIGGSRVTAATSDCHVMRLAFQSVSVLIEYLPVLAS